MSKKNKVDRFAPKLKIKKGDRVRVIAGASKGSEGEVLEVMVEKNRAIVENVNLVFKHVKATNENPGGINEIPAPLNISNLQVLDPKSGAPTRVGRKLVDGKLVRFAKKSGQLLD